jgi:hypothetical protein
MALSPHSGFSCMFWGNKTALHAQAAKPKLVIEVVMNGAHLERLPRKPIG